MVLNTFPNELLSRIFSLSVFRHSPTCARIDTEADLSEGRFWPCVLELDQGPWAISRVCRRWREVSLLFPELWNHFILSEDDLRLPLRRNPLAVIRQWLSYTRDAPISFLIQPYGVCTPENGTAGKDLIRLLVDHSGRWKQVEVINEALCLWALLDEFSLETTNLKSLEKITFVAEGRNRGFVDALLPKDAALYSDSDPSRRYRQVFSNAHNLRSLVIHDWIHPTIMTFPFANLTTYEGSAPRFFAEHYSILALAPNLETCLINLDLLEYSFRTKPNPISFSKLHTFRLVVSTDHHKGELKRYIRLLDMPALKKLSISAVLSTSLEDVATTLPHTNNIESLDLLTTYANTVEVGCLFSACPAVQHLSVEISEKVSLGNAVISRLMQEDCQDKSPVLPFLETLEFKIPGSGTIKDIDLPRLAAIIRMRWYSSSHGGIRNLWISIGEEDIIVGGNDRKYRDRSVKGEELPPILEVLQNEGLNLLVQVVC